MIVLGVVVVVIAGVYVIPLSTCGRASTCNIYIYIYNIYIYIHWLDTALQRLEALTPWYQLS